MKQQTKNTRAYSFVKASDFGSIWKPKKKGEEKILQVQARLWQAEKDGHFPVTLAADVETGEVFSLRTDLTYLRIVERVPEGGIVRLTYQGEGQRKGKKNAPRIFSFEYAECELAANSLQPPQPVTGDVFRAKKPRK